MPDAAAPAPAPLAVARSPIDPGEGADVRDGWLVETRTTSAPLRLADLSPSAKVLVRCAPESLGVAALGTGPGRAVRAGEGLVVGSGPGGWLVLAAPGAAGRVVAHVERRLAGAAREGALVTVVDVTHARALVRLTGDAAASVLAGLTTLDVRDRAVPNGTALRTALAGVSVEVVRADVVRADVVRADVTGRGARGGAGRVRSYLLSCDRELGQYLVDRLLDAGAPIGIGSGGDPDGGSGRPG